MAAWAHTDMQQLACRFCYMQLRCRRGRVCAGSHVLAFALHSGTQVQTWLC